MAEGPQADVIVAPSFDPDALEALMARRKATRLLEAPPPQPPARSSCAAWAAGFSSRTPTTWPRPVRTGRCRPRWRPPTSQWRDIELAWRVCARTSSNAIVVAADGQALGVGAGQQSRVEAAQIAVGKAGDRARGGAAASDAFFPFRDGLDVLAAAGRGGCRPARWLGPRRRGGGRRRRARHRHGAHRRASLPALSEASVTARLLDGEALAARFRAEVTDRVASLVSEGIRPGLGTILVGDDTPSERYVALKHADCDEVGIASVHEHLPAETSQEELEAVIARFNADPAVHAYLVQLPLPPGLDEEAALLADGRRQGRRRTPPGEPRAPRHGHARARCPCTPAGIVELLHAYDVPVEGRHVVVIGRGITIGRPLALLLALKRPGCNAAVTVVHTGVPDLAELRPPRRHRGGRGRLGRTGHARHGEARCGRGGCGHDLGGSQAPLRRRRVRGRGGRAGSRPASAVWAP